MSGTAVLWHPPRCPWCPLDLQIGQPQDYTQQGDPLDDAFRSVEKAVADAQKKTNGN